MKNRSIELQLIKPVSGSTNMKGRITLRDLQKELLTDLNVPFGDLCCPLGSQFPIGQPVRYDDGDLQYFTENNTWTTIDLSGAISITADNGLTMSTTTNVQLGGTLIQNTTIDTNTHTLSLTNSASGVVQLALSGASNQAMTVTTTGTIGLSVTAANEAGTFSAPGLPIAAINSSTNATSVLRALSLTRQSFTTGINGVGVELTYDIKGASLTENPSIRLIGTLTSVTDHNNVAEWSVWSVDGVTDTPATKKFTIDGATGNVRANIGGFKTDNYTGGVWKLGAYTAGVIAASTTHYITLSIDGVDYKMVVGA